MRCIVTGGAGFIGSQLVNKLEKLGHEVFSIDNAISDKNSGEYKYIWADICNPKYYQKILEVVRGADVFFHLAAKKDVQGSIANPVLYDTVNINGSLRMLELCAEVGVKRFVFASTCAVYGETSHSGRYSERDLTIPISPYGLQKLTVEKYCELYYKLNGIDTVSLRYFNVFGPGSDSGVIDVFLEQHKLGKPLTIYGSGDNSRDYVHVDDIVNANIAAAEFPDEFKGDYFNVGSGKSYSTNDIASAVIDNSAWDEEETLGWGKIKKLSENIEISASCAEIGKIKKVLNWEPSIDVLDWISNQ
jgi:UDP-glucose 4-epimerase